MTIGILILLGVLNANKPDLRIGHIFIIGNTVTPDRIILGILQVHPGQKLDPAKLREAQARLRASGLFRNNPWRGTGPTVQSVESDFKGYCNVVIWIEERDESWLLFAVLEFFEHKSGFDHLWDTLMRIRPHLLFLK